MKVLFAMALAGLATLAVPSLDAQDPGAAPAYGDVQLQGGFVPDPHTVQLSAGGSINVNTGNCTYGHVANAPDVDLRYSGNGSRTLYITVESSEDVTLLINMPNGSWVCDDDGFTGTNPIVVVQNAPSGLYDIWVGTYGPSTVQATLRISEIDPRGGRNQPAQNSRPTVSSGATPDPGATPAYGTVQLQGGFVPDPHTVQLTAGGSINVNMGSCTYGHVANAPDVDLRYSGNGSRTLYIYAEANEDVTLLINMPNGSWVCDDDGLGGRNPLVIVRNAPSGLYDIWVGSYGSGMVQANLRVSEIDPRGGQNQPAQNSRPTGSSGATPDPGATPAYGTVRLDGGFVPDPHTVQLTAGGSINVNTGSCTYGHVANAPDVDLYYNGNGSRTLYIYAEANEDVTLLINMPNGSWVCDDDGLGGRNPLVVVRNAPSGLYDIWVGSYGSGMVQANLRISEIAPSSK